MTGRGPDNQDDDRTRFFPLGDDKAAPKEEDHGDQAAPGTTRPAPSDGETVFVPGGTGRGPMPRQPGDDSTAPPRSTDSPLPQSQSQPQPKPAGPAAQGGGTAVTVGTLINNNYEISQVLKAGGMGEVYRGVEIGTGDPVAIKAILPELAEDAKAGQLFKREARTLRQLSDEAIVRYYNYVHDRELDRYFLVMEFVEGVPLSDYISSHGAISAASGQILLKRLARGLAKAHAREVIHRDLSPDNVMLPGGVVEEARLIDFGIAKSNVMAEETMHGQFAGKFKYVAPEQLGHYEGRITEQTDIYGLALLISSTVLGKPLDMGSSIFEAVQSRQSIPDLSGVPPELRPILSYMLEPNPDDRPASMDQVVQLLEAPHNLPAKYLDGGPVPPAMETTGSGPLVLGNTQRHVPINPTPGLQVPGGVTLQPRGATTQGLPPKPEPEPQHGKRGGGMMITLMVLVLAGLLGGAGWYAWNQGLIGGGAGGGATADAGGGTGSNGAGSNGAGGVAGGTAGAGIPAPVTSTREGYLAALDTGTCSYVTRVAAGPNAGMLEGFSASGQTFGGLPAAYEEKFGARPSILPRQIEDPQCAVLAFTRGLQGRGAPRVLVSLSADELESGGSLSGQVQAAGDQSVWAALVTPSGAVYNLTERLSDPVGGRRSMNFGLNLATGAEAAPQLVLTVASEQPLARAATAQDGALAAELLPALLADIARAGGSSSAALNYVLLKPAAPGPDAADTGDTTAPEAPGETADDTTRGTD